MPLLRHAVLAHPIVNASPSPATTSAPERPSLLLPWLVFGLALAATTAVTFFTHSRVAAQESERFEDAVQLERQTVGTVLQQRERFFESIAAQVRLAGQLDAVSLAQVTKTTNPQRWSPELLEIGVVAAPPDVNRATVDLTNAPTPLWHVARGVQPGEATTASLPGGNETLDLLRRARQSPGQTMVGSEFKDATHDTPRVLVVTGLPVPRAPDRSRAWLYALMDANEFYRRIPPSHNRALVSATFKAKRATTGSAHAQPQQVQLAGVGWQESRLEPEGNAWLRSYSFPAFGSWWTFAFQPTPDYYATSQAHLPWLVLGVGTLISLLLALGAWSQRDSQARIEALNTGLEQRIRERTADLAEANEQLTQAVEQEKEFARLKSTFVSMVSHEFRTPLGNIQSSAELLRNYFDRLPEPKRAELLLSITTSTRTMAGIMDDVLMLGRVDSVKYQCHLERLDLDGFCRHIIEEVRVATGERCPIQFQPGHLPPNVQADTTLLRHIFTNLLSNAVKYSPAGTPVEFSATCEDGAAIFVIRDRGVGIPEADRQHLFAAFQRGSNVGERPGTGLGLVIVKRCVDLYQGSIDIASAEGQGTTVTIRLPVEISESETTFITRTKPAGTTTPITS